MKPNKRIRFGQIVDKGVLLSVSLTASLLVLGCAPADGQQSEVDEVLDTISRDNTLREFQQQAAAEYSVELAQRKRQLATEEPANDESEAAADDTVTIEVPEGMTVEEALEAALEKVRQEREQSKQPVDDTVVLNERVIVSNQGLQGNDSTFDCPSQSISADGRFVVFVSGADNLVPNDTNSNNDVFVRDRQQGTTTRVSVASDGTEADDRSDGPSISADGRFVTFTSNAHNLADAVEEGSYLHDRITGVTVAVTSGSYVRSNSLQLSATGRFVVYSLGSGVFVYDQTSSSIEKVNPEVFGDKTLSGFTDATISADGTRRL